MKLMACVKDVRQDLDPQVENFVDKIQGIEKAPPQNKIGIACW